MQMLGSEDTSILPRFSFEVQTPRRSRYHRRSSSACGLLMPPILRTDGVCRKSFSYEKLTNQTFKLTIHKLDGSSFNVEVQKTATVYELKQAVEAFFSHMPTEGPGNISWPHVWGHFCLSYDSWKLLANSEPISNFGINDGDQLHFVRHVSITYNLIRNRSRDRLTSFREPRMSKEREENIEKDESSDDQENSQLEEEDEDAMSRCELTLARLFGEWFTYRRLGSPRKRLRSSRRANGFVASFKRILRISSSEKIVSHDRDPLEEV